MFNNRDLALLGAGGFLAVCCLLLPFPFLVKAILGILLLAGSMALALLRLGPDRIPLEEWLIRRLRYRYAVRRHAYQQAREAEKAQAVPPPPPPEPVPAVPLHFEVGRGGSYWLATLALAVLAVHFAAWLGAGGADELAQFLVR